MEEMAETEPNSTLAVTWMVGGDDLHSTPTPLFRLLSGILWANNDQHQLNDDYDYELRKHIKGFPNEIKKKN